MKSIVLDSLKVFSLCMCFAISLLNRMLMICVGSHHGGRAQGLMVSISWEYCGKVLARYSRAVICTLLVDDLALLIVGEIGLVGGAVCIRM